MADELWYYEKDGEQKGPVTQAELQALIEIGQISRQDLAWKPGEREWTQTGTFEVLLPSFKTPPPIANKTEAAVVPVAAPVQVVTAPGPREGEGIGPGAPVGEPPRPERSTPVPEKDQPSPVFPPPVAPQQPAGESQTLPPIPPIPQPPAGGSEPTTPPIPGTPQPSLFERMERFVAFLIDVKQLLSWPPQPPVLIGASLGLVVLTLAWLFGVGIPDWGSPGSGEPTPTSLHGTRVPAGYLGPVGQIKIDAYPWAEVTRIERGGEALDLPSSNVTPLVLLVAPGSYRIELGDFSCQLDVAAEASSPCKKIVRRVDAAAYYQEVGW